MQSPKCVSDVERKFETLRNFLKIPHPFVAEGFDTGEETFNYLHNECRVLVIGAGGLGCEILKCLALSGFGQIAVIDMDTVEVSNLNRQFLFKESDIGKPKASVAAEAINCRFGHLSLHIVPYVGPIQEKPVEFFKQFNVIIAGLDNIDARRWINSLLHSIVRRDPLTGEVDGSTIIPLFDGGTEGLRGQSRSIIPFFTSCFECSLATFPPKTTYPLCTISETPRLPEHCIERMARYLFVYFSEYAYLIEWSKTFPEKGADLGDPNTLFWIAAKAKERAEMYGIHGVTDVLTMGVVKRIVPAVASTNALIAASLVSEALKVSTYCGPILNSYMMYMGQSGVYTYTFPYAKNEECLVCAESRATVTVSKSITLKELLDNVHRYRLSVSHLQKGILFIQNPIALRQQHEYKLAMTLHQLIESSELVLDEPLIVTDPVIVNPLKLTIEFEKE